jgi:murein DD-endopeptidase MepM/ murein hydrolase activator NlpD
MLKVPDMHPSLPLNIEGYRGRTDPEAMKAVAKEMEAMFAYEMIKVMRETANLSSKGDLGKDTYMSMFDQQLSKLFAERGLGLQEMLRRGMKNIAEKSAPTPKVPDTQEKRPGEQVQHQAHLAEIKTLLPDEYGAHISSGYGQRKDPFTGETKFHHGLDIAAPEGTDIHPLRRGTVLFSGEQKGYGNVVIIDHGNGFVSKYAHNQANLVAQGQVVDINTVIAQVGSTGRSTGPHIHFEVLYRGEHVDPDMLTAQG